MSFEALLDEVHACRDRLSRPDDVDFDEYERLVARVTEVAPSLDTGQLTDLRDAFAELTEAAEARMEAVGEQLKQIQKSRRGVRGYARLRSHSTAQRLRKRA